MTAFNGLNGTILYNTTDLPIARVPGEPYGYKRPLQVTIDLRVERLERQEQYETVTHETVTAPLDFALATSVWRPDGEDIVAGGATVQPLLQAAAEGTDFHGTFDAGTAVQLADLHTRWHMNSMQAACAHQEVAEPPAGVTDVIAYRLDHTLPCPVTGYRYGTKWLVNPLPDGFLDDLRALLAGADQTRIYDLAKRG